MMETLFTQKIDTSKEAYLSVIPLISDMKARILTAIRANPSTDDGLEHLLNMKHQTLSARRRELVKDKLIEESGDYMKTRSGRKARVWRVTESGIMAISKWKEKNDKIRMGRILE